MTFAVALVTAMTATGRPTCRLRALTSSPSSDSARITNASGWTQHADAALVEAAAQRLDRDVRAAPQQAGRRGEQRAVAAGRRARTARARGPRRSTSPT